MDDIIYHPGHDHPLIRWGMKPLSFPLGLPCGGCKQGELESMAYCCPEEGCEYFLHFSCAKLGIRSQVDHPLHPQHPLTFHCKSYPNDVTEFVCSFCKKTSKTSGGCFLLHCAHCDFYLDFPCASAFGQNEQLLSQYEFQHFFHPHPNHNLLPHYSIYKVYCKACGLKLEYGELVLKCSDYRSCDYYIHVFCFRVPKEMKNHPLHPQHTLTLLERPPRPPPKLVLEDDDNDDDDDDDDDDDFVLHCTACHYKIENAYVLHCNQCPDFNLDTRCAFVNPTFKYDRHDDHDEHLLAYFDSYWGPDVRCPVCDTLCNKDLYRCLACNFNVHKPCAELPLDIADYDQHVHPFTLIINTSLNEEDESGQYYCDICEERRKPNRGVYSCVECPSFVAHFECLLPESYTVGKGDLPWMSQKFIQDIKNDQGEAETSSLAPLTSEEEQVLSQLQMEIEKMGEIVKQLLDKRHRNNVTQKLDQLQQSHLGTRYMLAELLQFHGMYNSSLDC